MEGVRTEALHATEGALMRDDVVMRRDHLTVARPTTNIVRRHFSPTGNSAPVKTCKPRQFRYYSRKEGRRLDVRELSATASDFASPEAVEQSSCTKKVEPETVRNESRTRSDIRPYRRSMRLNNCY